MIAALREAAHDVGLDPAGFADRDLALALLSHCKVDTTQPCAPMARDFTPIAEASTEYLAHRAVFVARDYEPEPTLTAEEAALIASTMSTSDALRWLSAAGRECTSVDLAIARHGREVTAHWARGKLRWRVEDLERFARGVRW